MLKNIIKNIASKFGLVLLSAYDSKRQEKYLEITEQLANSLTVSYETDCSIIIFSKDRAMQLDALLGSFFHFAKNPPALKIIYRASSNPFESAYDEVKTAYIANNVEFIKEQNFKADLTTALETINSSKVFFLVDDIIFKETVDFNYFEKIDPKKQILSLRLGKHLNFAYTLQKEQKLPDLSPSKEFNQLLSWDWNLAEYDWAYPLSVDGNLFDTSEVKIMVNHLNYKAPNSFEEALQLMTPLYAQRRGLCFEKSVIVNNPCNKVQTENPNVHGAITIEELNNKWLEGYRIDFKTFQGIENKSAHQELPLKFIKR